VAAVLLMKRNCSCFSSKAHKQNSYHTPYLTIFVIASKIADASEHDVAQNTIETL